MSDTLPWNAIDTVLLDMDGTLLDLHFDNHFWLQHLPQRYAEHHQCSLAQARAELLPLVMQINDLAADGWLKRIMTYHPYCRKSLFLLISYG